MWWTVGIWTAVLAAVVAAPTRLEVEGPTLTSKPSTRVNMSDGDISLNATTEPVSMETTTQNIFDDVISVTPPDAESIELQHFDDDTRYYPDYGDKDSVNNGHFTNSPNTRESSSSEHSPPRVKRQSFYGEYDALYDEMYLDPSYNRKRRDTEKDPFKIDLDIPDDSVSIKTDSSSSSDVQTAFSPSDPDSVSTQITYVIISEDHSSSDNATHTVIGNSHETDAGEHTTEVITLTVPSSESKTQSADTSSSSSDSVTERNRVLRAIDETIRAKGRVRSDNPKYRRRRRSSKNTGIPSSSELNTHLLSRKTRQIPHYYKTDITSYRIGRSVSQPSDSDDSEPEENRGRNWSTYAADIKLLHRVRPLSEYSSEFSELESPSSTYVDGKLSSDILSSEASRESIIGLHKAKRSLSFSEVSTEEPTNQEETEPTTEVSHDPTMSSQDLDIVTASYPLGVDATKNNLSVPEGIFLGPRIYAQGELVREEEPTITGISAPMEKKETIKVQNGSQTETVYSAPVDGLNLPLVIPVIGPTNYPGGEPRIELSVPSGYVPYIIELSPNSQKPQPPESNATEPGTKMSQPPPSAIQSESSKTPDVLKFLPSVPAVIAEATRSPLTASQTNMSDVSTQTNASISSDIPSATNPDSIAVPDSILNPEVHPVSISSEPQQVDHSTSESVVSQKTPSENVKLSQPSEEHELIPLKHKRRWQRISDAPAVETSTSSTQSTNSWQSASDAPTVDEGTNPQLQTARWEPIIHVPEGKPRPGTASFQPISHAPEGEVEISPELHTTTWGPVFKTPTAGIVVVPKPTVGQVSSSNAVPEVPTIPQRTSESSVGSSIQESGQSGSSAASLPLSDTQKAASSAFADDSNRAKFKLGKDEKDSTTGVFMSSESQKQPYTTSYSPDISGQREPNASLNDVKRSGDTQRSRVIPILEKNSVMSPNGSFSYSFKSGNGIQVQESGYLKTGPTSGNDTSSNGVAQAVQGSYSYTAPDGRLISVRYVADEKGFQPEVEDSQR